MRTHYDVMGITSAATQHEIEEKAEELGEKYLNGDPDAVDEIMAHHKEIETAYLTLRDPKKRAEYDLSIKGVGADATKRVKTYRVFLHPILGYQAVKVGFSWPGCFFGPFWALVKKLWWTALGLFCVLFLLRAIEIAFENNGSSGGVMLLAQLAVYIGVGMKGNAWRVSKLQKRGFELIDIVQAETPEAAIGAAAREREIVTPPQTKQNGVVMYESPPKLVGKAAGVSITSSMAFSVDEEAAALNREATQWKKSGDWDKAIAALQKISGGAGLRLPSFLQQAGRFEEAMEEFNRLLGEVDANAADMFSHQPEFIQKGQALHVKATIYDKMRLACKRQKLPDEEGKYAALCDECLGKFWVYRKVADEYHKNKLDDWREQQPDRI